MMVHVYNSRIGGRLNVIAGTVLDKIEKLNKLWLDFLFIFSFCIQKNDLPFIAKNKIRNFCAGLLESVTVLSSVEQVKSADEDQKRPGKAVKSFFALL